MWLFVFLLLPSTLLPLRFKMGTQTLQANLVHRGLYMKHFAHLWQIQLKKFPTKHFHTVDLLRLPRNKGPYNNKYIDLFYIKYQSAIKSHVCIYVIRRVWHQPSIIGLRNTYMHTDVCINISPADKHVWPGVLLMYRKLYKDRCDHSFLDKIRASWDARMLVAKYNRHLYIKTTATAIFCRFSGDNVECSQFSASHITTDFSKCNRNTEYLYKKNSQWQLPFSYDGLDRFTLHPANSKR